MLTPTKLHFTEETSQLTGNDDDDDTLSMDGDQPVTRQIFIFTDCAASTLATSKIIEFIINGII